MENGSLILYKIGQHYRGFLVANLPNICEHRQKRRNILHCPQSSEWAAKITFWILPPPSLFSLKESQLAPRGLLKEWTRDAPLPPFLEISKCIMGLRSVQEPTRTESEVQRGTFLSHSL